MEERREQPPPAALFTSSAYFLHPEQEAQQLSDGQQPACAALAAPARPSAMTAINSIAFSFFMIFLLFIYGNGCCLTDETIRAKDPRRWFLFLNAENAHLQQNVPSCVPGNRRTCFSAYRKRDRGMERQQRQN